MEVPSCSNVDTVMEAPVRWTQYWRPRSCSNVDSDGSSRHMDTMMEVPSCSNVDTVMEAPSCSNVDTVMEAPSCNVDTMMEAPSCNNVDTVMGGPVKWTQCWRP